MGPKQRCPLTGMRAPELAVGALSDVLDMLWRVGQAIALLSPAMALVSREDRGDILQDFVRARRHVRFVFSVKTSMWQHLPRVLSSIAHDDADKARHRAACPLRLFDSASAEARAHFLTATLCAPGTLGARSCKRYLCLLWRGGSRPVMRPQGATSPDRQPCRLCTWLSIRASKKSTSSCFKRSLGNSRLWLRIASRLAAQLRPSTSLVCCATRERRS